MRRALEYAAGLGVVARPALRGRRASPAAAHMHEGRVVAAGSASPAGPPMAEELMVAPRHRAGPAHRRPRALPAPVDRRQRSSWCARPRPTASPVTAEATPHHFTPHRRSAAPATTRCSRSTRRCARDADVAAVRAGLADGTIDAIATDHAPHTAGGRRSSRSTRRRPGCSAWRRRSALALAELDLPLDRGRSPLLSWQPAAHRRRRRPPRRPDRSRATRPTSSCSTPTPTLEGRPAPARQPQPQHALRRPHAARQGPPHGAPRRAGRHRRGAPAMNSIQCNA